MAFTLTVAGGKIQRNRREGKPQLLEELTLWRNRRPEIGTFAIRSVYQRGDRLRRQCYGLFHLRFTL
ncbi:hypothetical protein D3C80_2169270 [compost metagenome]